MIVRGTEFTFLVKPIGSVTNIFFTRKSTIDSQESCFHFIINAYLCSILTIFPDSRSKLTPHPNKYIRSFTTLLPLVINKYDYVVTYFYPLQGQSCILRCRYLPT